MSRVRRCCCLLAGFFCWLFLPGCISVDIETRAARNLSGTRTYRIIVEPMLAQVYRSGASAKMFDFPGQDLEKQKGVNVVSKEERKNEDGSLELVWSYKSDRLINFTTSRDTVIFSKRRHKWWIYYSYYERHLPRKDTSNVSAPKNAGFKNSLVMPGQVYFSNSDSLSGSRAVWLRTMDISAREGLVMVAESREINSLYVLLMLLIAGFSVALIYRRKI